MAYRGQMGKELGGLVNCRGNMAGRACLGSRPEPGRDSGREKRGRFKRETHVQDL